MQTYFTQWNVLGGAILCLSMSAAGCTNMGGGSWPSTNWFSWAKKPTDPIASKPVPPSANSLPSPATTAGVRPGSPTHPGTYPPANYAHTGQVPSHYPTGAFANAPTSPGAPGQYGASAPAGFAGQTNQPRNGQAVPASAYSPANGNPAYAQYGQPTFPAAGGSGAWGTNATTDYRAADARAGIGSRAAEASSWNAPTASSPSGPYSAPSNGNWQSPSPAGAATGTYPSSAPRPGYYGAGAYGAGSYGAGSYGAASGAAPGVQPAAGAAPTAPSNYKPGSTGRSTGMIGTSGGVQPAYYNNRSDFVPPGTPVSSTMPAPPSTNDPNAKFSYDRAVYPSSSTTLPVGK